MSLFKKKIISYSKASIKPYAGFVFAISKQTSEWDLICITIITDCICKYISVES